MEKNSKKKILNRTDYVSKIESLLQDATKFRPLDTDILDLCIKRKGKLIRYSRDTLLKNDIISESVYKDLFPTGSKPGILYGLPKVRKENCPARPIMSAIGTYNYRLAKFLVPIFQPFSINQYFVYNTFSFVKEITNFKSDTKSYMASFDVSSLFINIPLDETIDYAVNLVFENSDTYAHNDCSFNKEQL